MCPLDVTMGKAMAYFEIFLPTYSAFECPDKTYRLWFDEFLGFWSACANNPTWEPALMGNYNPNDISQTLVIECQINPRTAGQTGGAQCGSDRLVRMFASDLHQSSQDVQSACLLQQNQCWT